MGLNIFDCGCTSSCDCKDGVKGEDGINGLSAYDVWIQGGNVGTEQDFLDSLVGANGSDGADGADGNAIAKINEYKEVISPVHIKHSLVADVFVYHHPTGYDTLTYTNNSGGSKKYIVNVSYATSIDSANNVSGSNWVDGAIIKTVSGVDNVEYEDLSVVKIEGHLYDGVMNTNVVNFSSINKLKSEDGSNIEFRFNIVSLPKNVSFFKVITLLNGETASLKFKTKSITSDSFLNKAQFFINEID